MENSPSNGPNKGRKSFIQRKTNGQQLKGKIVSAPFHTFWHFSTLFHTFSEFFRILPPGLFLRIKGFYCCFSSKRIKENKKKKTKPFCTLVVPRLSSSDLFASNRKDGWIGQPWAIIIGPTGRPDPRSKRGRGGREKTLTWFLSRDGIFPDRNRVQCFFYFAHQNGERKLNTNMIFVKLFGHLQDIPAKSRDIPPKRFGFPGLEGHTELFGPHPFTWKTPTPPEDIWT